MHKKFVSMLIPFFLLTGMLAIVGIYASRKSGENDLRSRASNAVSCDYTINIALPTATPVPNADTTLPDVSCTQPASIALVIDSTSSMNAREKDGRTKLEWAKDAAKSFVKTIQKSGSASIKLSVISFGGQGNDGSGDKDRENDSRLHLGATTNYDEVLAAISSITLKREGTCGQCGIKIALSSIDTSTESKAIILMSDGQMNQAWDGSSANAKKLAVDEAQAARGKNITVYVLGYGNNGNKDEDTLKSIAGSGDRYRYKPDASSWSQAYLDLIPNFCTPKS